MPQHNVVWELCEKARSTPSLVALEPYFNYDPILTIRLFRHGASVLDARPEDQPTTITELLSRLGQKEVFNFLNIMKEGMTRDSKVRQFDPVKFARHAMFVATFGGKLVQVINQRQGQQFWRYEELYVAGLLHDLGYALVWNVASEIAWNVQQNSAVAGISFARAFEAEFGESLGSFGASIAESWGFNPLFTSTMRHAKLDPTDMRRFVAGATVMYAKTLANLSGYTASDDADVERPGSEILSSIGLMNEEAKQILQQVVLTVEKVYPLRLRAA